MGSMSGIPPFPRNDTLASHMRSSEYRGCVLPGSPQPDDLLQCPDGSTRIPVAWLNEEDVEIPDDFTGDPDDYAADYADDHNKLVASEAIFFETVHPCGALVVPFPVPASHKLYALPRAAWHRIWLFLEPSDLLSVSHASPPLYRELWRPSAWASWLAFHRGVQQHNRVQGAANVPLLRMMTSALPIGLSTSGDAAEATPAPASGSPAASAQEHNSCPFSHPKCTHSSLHRPLSRPLRPPLPPLLAVRRGAAAREALLRELAQNTLPQRRFSAWTAQAKARATAAAQAGKDSNSNPAAAPPAAMGVSRDLVKAFLAEQNLDLQMDAWRAHARRKEAEARAALSGHTAPGLPASSADDDHRNKRRKFV